MPTGARFRAAAALIGALALASCGGSSSMSTEPEPPKPAPLGIEITQEGNEFRMTAPSSIRAGAVDITLKTPPGKTQHDAQLIRVDGDHTVDEVLEVVSEGGKPIPDWLIAAGGVGQTPGGATGKANQQLAPGRYFIIDTAEETANAELEVTGEMVAAGEPEAPKPASITASEYSFVARGLKPGKNEIVFQNAGNQPHHVEAIPLADGATIDDVQKFFEEDGEGGGPPPIDFEQADGSAVLEGETKQVTELDLKAGDYVLACFISDREGGPPHVAQGMVTKVTVE